MTLDKVRQIDCTWDGQTVWVNMAGIALARFGYCTDETASVESWETFCAKMIEYYGIKIPVSARPKRLKVSGARARSSATS